MACDLARVVRAEARDPLLRGGGELTRDVPNLLASDVDADGVSVVRVLRFRHEERDGVVAAIAWSGHGCSISQSSASMMTEAVAGKDRAGVALLQAAVRGLLAGGAAADDLGDLDALSGVARYPVRIRCALLAWDVLDEAFGSSSG